MVQRVSEHYYLLQQKDTLKANMQKKTPNKWNLIFCNAVVNNPVEHEFLQ